MIDNKNNDDLDSLILEENLDDDYEPTEDGSSLNNNF